MILGAALRVGKLKEGRGRKRMLPTYIKMELINVHGHWDLCLDGEVNCLIYCIDA